MINNEILPNGFSSWNSVLEYMDKYPEKKEFSFHYFDLSSGYRIKKEMTLSRKYVSDKVIVKMKNNFAKFIEESINSSRLFNEKIKSGFFNDIKIIKTICLIFFISTYSYSQDTIRVKHINYSAVYSKSKHYPILVEWWLTKNKVNCNNKLKRVNEFKIDPLLPDYTDEAKDYINSGLDRGHNCPADDNLCQGEEVEKECFYYSNMTPQYHSLNAGDWKTLETLTRKLADTNDSVHVWCGSAGNSKIINNLIVPQKCWKIIYIKKTKEWFYYIFNNSPDKPVGLDKNKTTLNEIKKLTKLNIW